MYDIRPMPVQIDSETISRLEKVETATVGHFLHSQFADSALRAVLPGRRVAGTAVTLRIPGADSTLLHYAMSLVRPGDFLVIDRAGDRRHACWGGGVTVAARRAGVVGAVIDGPGTDFSEIRQADMPVWCRGPSPITTKLLGLESAMNVPVSVGGCVIEPGDAVLADESGVLFLSPDQCDQVASRAITMQENEITMLERLRAGERLADLSGATEMVEGKRAG